MLWLYLYFPSLQLDCLYQDSEAIEEKAGTSKSVLTTPLIIVDGKSNQVVQVNQAAVLAGIKVGMGIATSASLCHDLQVIPYQEDIESIQLKHIAQQLYGLTADISFDPPHGLYIKVGNMLTLYQSFRQYWQVMEQHLTQENYHLYFASAYSPYAAKLIALAQINLITEDSEKIAKVLSGLPTSLLEVSDKNKQALQRLGIKQIGQLLALDRKALTKRFEQAFTLYLTKVKGELPCSLVVYQPDVVFSRYLELLYEVSNTKVLLHPLKKLYGELTRFMLLRGLASQQVKLTFFQRDRKTMEINIGSAQSCDCLEKWLSLTAIRFEKVQLSAPVIALQVDCHQLQNKHHQSGELFNHQKSTMTEAELISLLQAKVGEEKVCRIQVSDEHTPEKLTLKFPANHFSAIEKSSVVHPDSLLSAKAYADRFVHCREYQADALSFKQAKQAKHTVQLRHANASMHRPSFLITPPQPLIEAVDIVSGPERIETAWWHTTIQRDYYIARNQQGQWCWLFRQADQRWFLHGYFG